MGLTPTADAVWGMRDRLEEPDVRPTSPVLWELGAGNRPWLPDLGFFPHQHLGKAGSTASSPSSQWPGHHIDSRLLDGQTSRYSTPVPPYHKPKFPEISPIMAYLKTPTSISRKKSWVLQAEKSDWVK